VAPERQNELTRRIQQRLASVLNSCGMAAESNPVPPASDLPDSLAELKPTNGLLQ